MCSDKVTEFRERLISLRTQKDVSANKMSLSIGQSKGYINKIENQISMPVSDEITLSNIYSGKSDFLYEITDFKTGRYKYQVNFSDLKAVTDVIFIFASIYKGEYLELTPMEFFDYDDKYPQLSKELINVIRRLNCNQTQSLINFLNEVI